MSWWDDQRLHKKVLYRYKVSDPLLQSMNNYLYNGIYKLTYRSLLLSRMVTFLIVLQQKHIVSSKSVMYCIHHYGAVCSNTGAMEASQKHCKTVYSTVFSRWNVFWKFCSLLFSMSSDCWFLKYGIFWKWWIQNCGILNPSWLIFPLIRIERSIMFDVGGGRGSIKLHPISNIISSIKFQL